MSNVRVFAGTTDDAFRIDLGGGFDTLNAPKGAAGAVARGLAPQRVESGRFSEAHRPGRGGMHRRAEAACHA